MLRSVDLPLPDGPEQDQDLAGEDVEIHAPQRVHLDFAHVVDLRHAARLEDRSGVIAAPPRGPARRAA